MKKFMIGIFVTQLLISSAMAQDPGVGTAASEFKRNLDQKLNEANDLMQLQISNRNLNFSDYTEASKELLNKIEASQERLKSSLTDIEDFLSLYDTIRVSQNNRAMVRLFEQKKRELDNLRKNYRNATVDYIGLGGFSNIPISTEINKVKYTGYDWYLIANTTIQNALTYNVIESSMDVRYSRHGYFGKREELKSNLQNGLHSIVRTARNTIFEKCQTQGCIYYIAEDVALWLKSSQKVLSSMNIPVEGVKPFTGASFTTKFKNIQSGIDSLADEQAQGRPTSL